MIFVNAVSLTGFTSSQVLFSSYQNKKFAWDVVSIYTAAVVLDLTKFSKY